MIVSFPRSLQLYIVFLEPRFSENSSPFGTNNSRGQISWHIFAPKGRHSLYNQKFQKLEYLLKIKRAKRPEKFAFSLFYLLSLLLPHPPIQIDFKSSLPFFFLFSGQFEATPCRFHFLRVNAGVGIILCACARTKGRRLPQPLQIKSVEVNWAKR